jgi:hypothetical protein
VRNVAPRDVARRDLDEARIASVKLKKNLEERSDDFTLPEEDRADALRRLTSLALEKEALDVRYATLTGPLPEDHPDVAEELGASQLLHQDDYDRLVLAEKRLERYTQARITQALSNPLPYHSTISADPSLDPAEAHARRLEQIVAIEEYRAKWAIDDPEEALGRTPADGLQAEEWEKAMRLIHQYDEEREQGYAMSR